MMPAYAQKSSSRGNVERELCTISCSGFLSCELMKTGGQISNQNQGRFAVSLSRSSVNDLTKLDK